MFAPNAANGSRGGTSDPDCLDLVKKNLNATRALVEGQGAAIARICRTLDMLVSSSLGASSNHQAGVVRSGGNDAVIVNGPTTEPSAEEVIRMLKAMSPSCPDAHEPMRALMQLIYSKSANRIEFCEQGGILALVAVLDFPCRRAFEEAALALQILSGERKFHELMTQNIVLLPLCRMLAETWSAVARARATETLHNLFVNANPMELHPSIELVQHLVGLLPPEKCCFDDSVYRVAHLGISKFAQNSGLRACLVEEGALEPLIRALGVEGKLLPLLLGLMTEEGLALKHLASIIVNFSKDDDMRAKILEAGIVEPAVQLLTGWTGDKLNFPYHPAKRSADWIVKEVLRLQHV